MKTHNILLFSFTALIIMFSSCQQKLKSNGINVYVDDDNPGWHFIELARDSTDKNYQRITVKFAKGQMFQTVKISTALKKYPMTNYPITFFDNNGDTVKSVKAGPWLMGEYDPPSSQRKFIFFYTPTKYQREKIGDHPDDSTSDALRNEMDSIVSNYIGKEYSNQNKPNADTSNSTCIFDNPDTSLSNIFLRDPESANQVLRVKKLNGDSTYSFYSSDKKEILSVTVHPGDGYSAVSIFNIRNSRDANMKPAKSTIQSFRTEKNIHLGLTKADIIKKLGTCYTANDSTGTAIELNYRLETPRDSRTKLLERQNMPIYYAIYKLRNDRLIEFEFGFEYP